MTDEPESAIRARIATASADLTAREEEARRIGAEAATRADECRHILALAYSSDWPGDQEQDRAATYAHAASEVRALLTPEPREGA